ncbi:MAG TPA: hypothetical protein ENI62_11645 [Gammaproteobacteria bacterium]|nr:hypothetical protein [Gammaproteobacteria bacterium]
MQIDKTLGKTIGLLNSDQSNRAVQAVVETANEVRHHPVDIGRRQRAKDRGDKERRSRAEDRRMQRQRKIDRPVLLNTRSRHDRRRQLRRTTLSNTGANNKEGAVASEEVKMPSARGIDTKA